MEYLIKHPRLKDLLKISEMLKENTILLDPLNINSVNTCAIENYLILPNTSNLKCLLDRNIVSYLVQLSKGTEVTYSLQNLRLTAALQAFLYAANIQSEPCMAYYEYLNSVGVEKADKEFSFFRSADNLDPNIYLDIALGNIDIIPQYAVKKFENDNLILSEDSNKLFIFDTNIVFIKKAILLKESGLRDYDVLLKLLDWIYEYYIFSSPSFHFLSIYFSSNRIAKMIKSSSLKDVENATWDLCLIQQLLAVMEDNPKEYWFVASFDRAIKETIELVIFQNNESNEEYFERLQEKYSTMWGRKNNFGKELLIKFQELLNNIRSPNRGSVKNFNDVEYLKKIKNEVNNEFKSKFET